MPTAPPTTMETDELQQLLETALPGWNRLRRQAESERRPLYLVGGALRDALLGRHPGDFDLICPEEDFSFWEDTLSTLFAGKFFAMGTRAEQFQIRRLTTDAITIDLALLENGDLGTNLARRDFTINAMALGLHDGCFHDPHQGRNDLAARRIRAIAAQNLAHDPLRIIRAVRFLLELDGHLTPATQQAMRAAADSLELVAGERLAAEFNHIFSMAESTRGLRELAAIGALQKTFPPLAELEGLQQNHYHHLDAFEHTLAVCENLDRLCRENPFSLELSGHDRRLLKWAGLFHDTGKALTRNQDRETGIIHFHGHERFSAHLAEKCLGNFALGKDFLRRLKRLIENHLRPLQLSLGGSREKSRRRLVFDLEEDLGLLLLHALADLEGTRGRDPAHRINTLLQLGRELLTLFEQEKENLIKPLLTGRDLIALGMEPGPAMGTIIRLLHKRQIAGEICSREEALAAARKLLVAEPAPGREERTQYLLLYATGTTKKD